MRSTKYAGSVSLTHGGGHMVFGGSEHTPEWNTFGHPTFCTLHAQPWTLWDALLLSTVGKSLAQANPAYRRGRCTQLSSGTMDTIQLKLVCSRMEKWLTS